MSGILLLNLKKSDKQIKSTKPIGEQPEIEKSEILDSPIKDSEASTMENQIKSSLAIKLLRISNDIHEIRKGSGNAEALGIQMLNLDGEIQEVRASQSKLELLNDKCHQYQDQVQEQLKMKADILEIAHLKESNEKAMEKIEELNKKLLESQLQIQDLTERVKNTDTNLQAVNMLKQDQEITATRILDFQSSLADVYKQLADVKVSGSHLLRIQEEVDVLKMATPTNEENHCRGIKDQVGIIEKDVWERISPRFKKDGSAVMGPDWGDAFVECFNSVAPKNQCAVVVNTNPIIKNDDPTEYFFVSARCTDLQCSLRIKFNIKVKPRATDAVVNIRAQRK